jgi:transcriptional regulator with XRE-family HTH domain
MEVGEVLARNVKAARGLRDMNQGDLAEAMSSLGHSWTLSVASRLEKVKREVSVRELLDLAQILGYTVPDLLFPPAGEMLDLSTGPVGRLTARSWLEGAFAWLLEKDDQGNTVRRTVDTQREPVRIDEEDLR